MAHSDFERIRNTWLNIDQPSSFAADAARSGVEFSNASAPTRVTLSALRGPDFISTWLECSPVEAEFKRHTVERRARTMFLFVNSGRVQLSAGASTQELGKGAVVALRPGAETVHFEGRAAQSDVLIFSIKAMLGLMMGRSDEAPIQVLPEASLNAFAFGACFGLAQALPPSSANAGRELQNAAVAVARSLLMQWVMPHGSETNLYSATRRFIRVHAIDQSLTPLSVANEFGVSERTLQAVFQQNNETVARAIRRSRSDLARAWLEAGQQVDPGVVALNSGFTSAKRMRAALAEFEPPADATLCTTPHLTRP
ncbi:hypothetical protein [Pseudoclavibacter helvolus]|uniref:hypothetical protein n=1 Tax=Pseudoclavibacter helvolus TaxID=255205 RepID=UPI003C750CD2